MLKCSNGVVFLALIEHLLHPLANKKTAALEGGPITHKTLRCRSRGYYSKRDAERGIPVRQKVEYKSVQELWKQLKALPSQYNCNYSIPQSDEVEKLFEIFNLLSGDICCFCSRNYPNWEKSLTTNS